MKKSTLQARESQWSVLPRLTRVMLAARPHAGATLGIGGRCAANRMQVRLAANTATRLSGLHNFVPATRIPDLFLQAAQVARPIGRDLECRGANLPSTTRSDFASTPLHRAWHKHHEAAPPAWQRFAPKELPLAPCHR